MPQERMTERIITVVLTLVVAGILGVVGNALSGGALIGTLGGVEETKPTYDQRIGTLSERADTLQTEIQGATSVPTGAVMAFDLATGCPDGWAAFEDAGGRTVIGAGAGMIPGTEDRDDSIQTKKYRQHGGVEKVTLNAAEMPIQRHETTEGLAAVDIPGQVGFFIPDVRLGKRNNLGVRVGTTTRASGGGNPHNNMPPYIALYFCKKD